MSASPSLPPAWSANPRRVLVTGCAGFLGSTLSETLVEAGHDVICVDNFFTSQKSNVAHPLDHANFELIRHDVTMPVWLEVDQIYNLACPASPPHYQHNPIKTIKTSTVGMVNVLGIANPVEQLCSNASERERPRPELPRGGPPGFYGLSIGFGLDAAALFSVRFQLRG